MALQWGTKHRSMCNVWHRLNLTRGNIRFSASLAYSHAFVEEATHKEVIGVFYSKRNPDSEKFYVLPMFPYPSGALHMGHVRVYTISDTIARFRRMEGKKVIHPIGWDAFGLPAENAAIERNINPSSWTRSNIAYMKSQLERLSCSFDWNRELSTCSPSYYKWTQWLFLQLYKQNLVYQDEALVNWDPVDKTVLANEQVDAQGKSWRSGALVEKRRLKQWFFRITKYAEELETGLKDLDWPENVKEMQKHWIGRSEGSYFDFKLTGFADVSKQHLRVFTTHPEVIYGVQFLAVAPTHVLADQLDAMTRQHLLASSMSGDDAVVQLQGITATHPFTKKKLPIFAAAFVADGYGTGAVMGVPAHDVRDHDLANHMNIDPKFVVTKTLGDIPGPGPYTGDGFLINSGPYTGLKTHDAASAIVDRAAVLGFGGSMVSYRLRDWLVSRQRYWGTPIPLIHCANCGVVPVPSKNLPVILPEDARLSGKSPISNEQNFINVDCPECKSPAQRDSDTMDTFVDSAWYFLRFLDPTNTTLPVSPNAAKEMPVDLYVGGIEHAVLHLLYARFVNFAIADMGLVKHREPFLKLLAQGMVHGETYCCADSGRYLKPEEVIQDSSGTTVSLATGKPVHISWEKMSKSKYNGVDPTKIFSEYGVDATRLFILFKKLYYSTSRILQRERLAPEIATNAYSEELIHDICNQLLIAPPTQVLPWDEQAIQGVKRWLGRLWSLVHKAAKLSNEVTSHAAVRYLGITRQRTTTSSLLVSQPLNNCISVGRFKSGDTFIVMFIEFTVHIAANTCSSTYSFNTAVAELMKLSNTLKLYYESATQHSPSSIEALRVLLVGLAPMAPHISCALWNILDESPTTTGFYPKKSVFAQSWPEQCEVDLTSNDKREVAVQIQGRIRGTLQVDAQILDQQQLLCDTIMQTPFGQKWISDKEKYVARSW